MSGEIRSENFADEASWLEFQHNQLELARHKRQRQAAQQYAAVGRDYDIIKRINRRVQRRVAAYRRYWADPEKARAKSRRHHWKHREHRNTQTRQYMARWRINNRKEDARRSLAYRTANREVILERLDAKRARDPEHYRQADRKSWAKHRGRYNAEKRLRYADDPEYRARIEAARARRPGYKSKGERARAAQQFEAQVIEARVAGFSWAEVAALLNRTVSSCKHAFYRSQQEQSR